MTDSNHDPELNMLDCKNGALYFLPQSKSLSVKDYTKKENKRATWSRQLEFFLSCVGYAVGLGNIWRFPYLCYKSGGGAFLVPYFTFLVICGMPLFLLEMSLGQFGSLGSIAIWKISPIFKGLGYGMAIVSLITCIYYNVIIAWALYYIYQSYYVPWSSCENSWNTLNCVSQHAETMVSSNVSSVNNRTEIFNRTYAINPDLLSNSSKMTSSEEFWLFNVLQQSSGIENLGPFQWPLVFCLFIAWVLVFVCVMRGIKSSGKVVYVTATLPYVVLLCFLVRGLTLPGASNGILFFLSPKWEKLLSFKVWGDAATQIFFSNGTAWGALLTMSSPGLAFVVYPEAISRLPVSPAWAFLFFFMLLAVGLDTQFGEPCVTQGGIYVVQLMDWYSAAFSLMFFSLFETIAIAWVYGVDRFFHDISLMTQRMPCLWWKLCWCYITPATITSLLVFIFVNHTSITYNDYVYPAWSIGIGWSLAMCSIAPIPIVALWMLLKEKGNFKQRLVNCLRPTPDWGPALEENRILYRKSKTIVSSRFEQNHLERKPCANRFLITDSDVMQRELPLLQNESCM
ncbi:sodium- and chloride-dependent glycine transporter 2 [Trichonephila inaurata madagascariensis]|uniref:Transporter n=1 Tax=Trichonephila inaurata madagascariensis TaxID=2747483 RepID=A0A8X6YKK5_9ARAC|nr:sodium- and chloride-dependent glycine transporter 2 [Trichonephila inaurata madagascariensis]